MIDGTDAPPTVTSVIVREGLVRRVTTAPPPEASTIVDGTGKFLIPGLWDMHVHLATRLEPELAEKDDDADVPLARDRRCARHGWTP
ncbi:hypothetical protein BH18ACI5_BH18ACI5_21370 [soil metagenome]